MHNLFLKCFKNSSLFWVIFQPKYPNSIKPLLCQKLEYVVTLISGLKEIKKKNIVKTFVENHIWSEIIKKKGFSFKRLIKHFLNF